MSPNNCLAASEASRAAAAAARAACAAARAAGCLVASSSLLAAAHAIDAAAAILAPCAVVKETAERVRVLESDLAEKVAAGAARVPLVQSGSKRAARNVAAHWCLGAGPQALQQALAAPQRAQRGRRRRRKDGTTDEHSLDTCDVLLTDLDELDFASTATIDLGKNATGVQVPGTTADFGKGEGLEPSALSFSKKMLMFGAAQGIFGGTAAE